MALLCIIVTVSAVLASKILERIFKVRKIKNEKFNSRKNRSKIER